jgi:Asp-tRNA(Asn)/Glu-tRNA(Gln) amidotransferase C subunit
MSQTPNPLQRFFRQPAIYLRLPSQGRTWPAGTLDLPVNGELPVLPMTAMDEITYRTPDALFNGEAVVSVIQSCLPNVIDAWAAPSTDVDAMLIAIRIASYGHSMDIATQCPACETEAEFGLDLRTVIDRLAAGDYSQPLMMGDLEIYFRPLCYREMTDNNNLQFEQQKTLNLLADAEAEESAKIEQINAMMRRIMEITVTTMAQSIQQIRVREDVVTDQQQIQEFITNCDRAVFGRIKDHVIALRANSELRPLDLTCGKCSHQYQQAFTVDMSRFFESDS